MKIKKIAFYIIHLTSIISLNALKRKGELKLNDWIFIAHKALQEEESKMVGGSVNLSNRGDEMVRQIVIYIMHMEKQYIKKGNVEAAKLFLSFFEKEFNKGSPFKTHKNKVSILTNAIEKKLETIKKHDLTSIILQNIHIYINNHKFITLTTDLIKIHEKYATNIHNFIKNGPYKNLEKYLLLSKQWIPDKKRKKLHSQKPPINLGNNHIKQKYQKKKSKIKVPETIQEVKEEYNQLKITEIKPILSQNGKKLDPPKFPVNSPEDSFKQKHQKKKSKFNTLPTIDEETEQEDKKDQYDQHKITDPKPPLSQTNNQNINKKSLDPENLPQQSDQEKYQQLQKATQSKTQLSETFIKSLQLPNAKSLLPPKMPNFSPEAWKKLGEKLNHLHTTINLLKKLETQNNLGKPAQLALDDTIKQLTTVIHQTYDQLCAYHNYQLPLELLETWFTFLERMINPTTTQYEVHLRKYLSPLKEIATTMQKIPNNPTPAKGLNKLYKIGIQVGMNEKYPCSVRFLWLQKALATKMESTPIGALDNMPLEETRKTLLASIGIPLINENQKNYPLEQLTIKQKKFILTLYQEYNQKLNNIEESQFLTTKKAIQESYKSLFMALNYYNNLTETAKLYLAETENPLLNKWIQLSYQRVDALQEKVEELGKLYQELLVYAATNLPEKLHATVYHYLLKKLNHTNTPLAAVSDSSTILQKLQKIIQAKTSSQDNQLIEIVLKNIFTFLVYEKPDSHAYNTYLKDASSYASTVQNFIEKEGEKYPAGEHSLNQWLLPMNQPTAPSPINKPITSSTTTTTNPQDPNSSYLTNINYKHITLALAGFISTLVAIFLYKKIKNREKENKVKIAEKTE